MTNEKENNVCFFCQNFSNIKGNFNKILCLSYCVDKIKLYLVILYICLLELAINHLWLLIQQTTKILKKLRFVLN